MNIFHLHAERRSGGVREAGIWLVVADSLVDALSLVPQRLYVKAAEVQIAAVAGPSRVIACLARPTILHQRHERGARISSRGLAASSSANRIEGVPS